MIWVEVVLCDVSALMVASRTGHDIVGFERTFAGVQIGEEEDRRFTFFAGDDDVPTPGFGIKHGETPILSGWAWIWCRPKSEMSSQFFS